MTLRLRLVLALMLLTALGLGIFGIVTYHLYAQSQYQRLDDQIRTAVPFATRQLTGAQNPGGTSPPGGSPPAQRPPGGHDNPPPQLPIATYSELRDDRGRLVTSAQLTSATSKPKLPTVLAPARPSRFFTVGSASGSGTWRVYVTAADGDGDTTPAQSVLVAVPMGDVTNALHRLTLIETIGGAALLLILSAGAWLILRRGLHPIEDMADTASAISGGDLSRRVATAAPSSEVGQLAIAFNTMLDEIQAAFAQRDATEHRLRQFLTDASHELRTPLTSIQGFAELFRIADREDVDLPTVLRRIEQESERMKVLVEDLLVLARLDQTHVTQRRPVDVAVLAADACADACATAPDRPISLDAPDPVTVEGDESLLRQAVANLVTNAIGHTPAGSAIDVSARCVGGTARLVVRDHGPGLDDETLDHAFDRFWQADRARVGAGAGLGLSIVASVAEDHGGRVRADNAPDGGAVFTLDIPAAASG